MSVVFDQQERDRRAAARHPEKAHRPESPILRKPEWIRVKAPGGAEYAATRAIVREHGLHTVCEEAGCPNIGECWNHRHATMMIMGDTCTRACAFCNVKTGMPGALDTHEPANVGKAVAKLGLKHVVITSVDRDDLADGGAEHFAQTIRAIREFSPGTSVEVLTPDFLRKPGALDVVMEARPDVFNHNLETVPRLVSDRAAGRALLCELALAGTREGTRSHRLHQIRPDGRLGRIPRRDHAGDGRSARGEC